MATLASLASVAFGQAHAQTRDGLRPSAVFVQEGWAGDTRDATVGAVWDWDARWSAGGAEVTGYWEGSLSRWSYEALQAPQTAWLAQLGLIPVFRFRPRDGWTGWFFDLGVGLTLTTRLYQSDQRQFSTRFNFGDHLAVGRSFGADDRHEIALRAEHFSNAGVRRPNPGINFVQLRYSLRLD